MDTAKLNRKAARQVRRVQSGVETVGRAARARAGELSKAAGSRAHDVRTQAGARARDTRRRVGFWIAGEKPTRHPARWAVLAGAAGAAAAFFLDPVSGKRRRHVTRDWVAARVRGIRRRTGRAGRAAGAQAYGAWQSVRHAEEATVPENDQTLAHKVESEVLRGSDVPASRILVNAENGVVVLRGVVGRPEEIGGIEDRVRRVNGVLGVDNRLHVEGTPAPLR